MVFERIIVIGLGLIGGSIIRHLRRAEAVQHVIGIDANAASSARALELGMIDTIGEYDAASFDKVQLVIIATPVGMIGSVLESIAPLIRDYTVVTDVGSTKADVVRSARQHLGDKSSHFVAGHPIAGIERSGIDAAFDGLYTGQLVVLTPLENTDPAAVLMVEGLWAACGANCAHLSPEEHDEVLAATSHLPHVLAFAMINALDDGGGSERFFEYSAGGFRSFSRIASGDPVMWRDIVLANKQALLEVYSQYQEELDRVMALIESDDAQAIEAYFKRARDSRNRSIERHG